MFIGLSSIRVYSPHRRIVERIRLYSIDFQSVNAFSVAKLLCLQSQEQCWIEVSTTCGSGWANRQIQNP